MLVLAIVLIERGAALVHCVEAGIVLDVAGALEGSALVDEGIAVDLKGTI